MANDEGINNRRIIEWRGAVSTGQAEDEVRGAGKAINSSVCILPPCIVARGGEGNKSQQDVCCGVARGGTWVPMLCKWHRSLPMRDDAFTWKTATTQQPPWKNIQTPSRDLPHNHRPSYPRHLVGRAPLCDQWPVTQANSARLSATYCQIPSRPFYGALASFCPRNFSCMFPTF